VGNQERYGVPKPAHPMWREHATLSQELLPYIGHGWIAVKPNVSELRGDSVAFVDDTEQRFDTIIHATGYNTTFPFLDGETFDAEHDIQTLYRRITPPRRPGLYFAGLVQPVGPTIPLVEIQSRWMASVLAGDVRLPDSATMDREIDRHRRTVRKKFVNAPRYTLEVDFKTYARALKKDMAKGTAGA
jgi:hypothetical protein